MVVNIVLVDLSWFIHDMAFLQIKTTYPDIAASVVYDVLHDQEYRSNWDKYALEVKDIGHLNPNNSLSYYASKNSK